MFGNTVFYLVYLGINCRCQEQKSNGRKIFTRTLSRVAEKLPLLTPLKIAVNLRDGREDVFRRVRCPAIETFLREGVLL